MSAFSTIQRNTAEYGGIKTSFFMSFFVIFVLSFSVLNTIGFVPEAVDEASDSTRSVIAAEEPAISLTSTDNPQETPVFGDDLVPRRIVIESVGIDVSIENPVSRDIAVLDDALLRGAVRYPGSGYLDDPTNMFIFGHSSHLPAVNNPSFQAFNGLERAKKGDIVRVESEDTVNIYRVSNVTLIDAEEALVDLTPKGKRLTLSTCNNFGNPGDRYLLEAEYIETRTR